MNQLKNTKLKSLKESQVHESAVKHVSGTAVYVDDRLEFPNQLHIAIIKSSIAKGRITSMNLDSVYASQGVVDILTVDDIPGEIDIGPVFKGDPLLTSEKIEFYGQAICAVIAKSHKHAVRAAQCAKISYQQETACFDVLNARDNQSFVRPPHALKRGDAERAIQSSEIKLDGELNIGWWYECLYFFSAPIRSCYFGSKSIRHPDK